ncbi:MAG: peptidase, family [Firmicutes bacterium]|nr:peptidase, family [Bacillota bacterium]
MKSPVRILRFLLALILVASLMLPLTACAADSGSAAQSKVADYGTYGSKLALKLAADFPTRSPGSAEETAAREFLTDAFKDLGYKVTVQEFTFTTADGQSASSANMIVNLDGTGVPVTDASGKKSVEQRQVIIGAHYDVSVTAEQAAAAAAAASATTTQATTTAATESSAETTTETTASIPEPTLADFDGIHANASGIGALFTAAKQLKRVDREYDVVLIAFGAGTAAQAGAKAYLHSMSEEDIARTDAMYNIDGVYAGDEMYAHAGQNSVLPGNQKIYEKRRKLYEATDVFFENELYTNNGYNLNTNQSSINVLLGDTGNTAIYREWTQHESDHTPFDQAGIPIVFFESYDYDYAKLEDMKETKNPALSATGGKVRDTQFDSTAFLQYLFTNTSTQAKTDSKKKATTVERLEQRINNTAFVIVEAVKKRETVTTGTTTG